MYHPYILYRSLNVQPANWPVVFPLVALPLDIIPSLSSERTVFSVPSGRKDLLVRSLLALHRLTGSRNVTANEILVFKPVSLDLYTCNSGYLHPSQFRSTNNIESVRHLHRCLELSSSGLVTSVGFLLGEV